MRACPSPTGSVCGFAPRVRLGACHRIHLIAWRDVRNVRHITRAEVGDNDVSSVDEVDTSKKTSKVDVAKTATSHKPKHNRRGDNAARDKFTDTLRETYSGGRVSKRDFKSHLGKLQDPNAALDDVTVILVGTKKAGNVGAIARACGSFECEDLRLVSPRCDPHTRASLSAAKGAQHIVHGAGVYDTLEDALLDVDCAIAFHVWTDGLEPENVSDVDSLIKLYPKGLSIDEQSQTEYPLRYPVTEDPVELLFDGARRERIRGGGMVAEGAAGSHAETDTSSSKVNESENDENDTAHGWRVRTHVTPPSLRANRGVGKLALVFGREVEGLTDQEVNACDAMCSIPTGRLIESLSVSHAAVIILSQYFQSRQ